MQLERSLQKLVAGQIRAQARVSAQLLRKDGNLKKLKTALEPNRVKLEKILATYYKRTTQLFGDRAFAQMKVKSISIIETKDIEDVFDAAMQEFIGTQALEQSILIDATTASLIRDAVEKLAAEDMSLDAIANNLQTVTGGFVSESRAKTIATTEVHSAASYSSFTAAESTGEISTKEWIASLSERTRESHASVNGSVIPIDEAFKVGDSLMMHPGDTSASAGEVINCRCVLIYGVQ